MNWWIEKMPADGSWPDALSGGARIGIDPAATAQYEQEQRQMAKPILCLDFDGVINSYTSGWVAADKIPDPVTPGFIPWLIEADLLFRVAIFSSRSHQPGGREAMQAYIWAAMGGHFDLSGHPDEHHAAYGLMERLEFPMEKPPALITIDDRAMTFTGSWDDFPPVALLSFRPWNKLPAGVKVLPPSLPTAEERAWVPIMTGVAIALVATVLAALWRAG